MSFLIAPVNETFIEMKVVEMTTNTLTFPLRGGTQTIDCVEVTVFNLRAEWRER